MGWKQDGSGGSVASGLVSIVRVRLVNPPIKETSRF